MYRLHSYAIPVSFLFQKNRSSGCRERGSRVSSPLFSFLVLLGCVSLVVRVFGFVDFFVCLFVFFFFFFFFFFGVLLSFFWGFFKQGQILGGGFGYLHRFHSYYNNK